MNDRERRAETAQRLELLDLYHRNRRTLERREARYDVLEVPLDLRSALVEVREGIDEVEARLQQIQADDVSGEAARLVHEAHLSHLENETKHLRALQKVRCGKETELERRVVGYGPGQAPLKVLNSLTAEQEALQALEARLRRTEAELAELKQALTEVTQMPAAGERSVTLRVFIATPDGARYATEVESDLLVAQLQSAFLANWQPPAGAGPVRHTLRPEPEARPLELPLTLAEAGIQDGVTLHLVQEALSPASPVGLTVEDDQGHLYTTAVQLDTPVDTLAQAFLGAVRGSGQAVVELSIGSAGTRQYRPLRPNATLYEEQVGDGARLRILPIP